MQKDKGLYAMTEIYKLVLLRHGQSTWNLEIVLPVGQMSV